MERSYLIQRLEKPFKMDPDVINPFPCVGGLKNGGLSDDAIKMLQRYFRFDYMGSAEFEYGAVPEALQTIAQNIKDFEAFEIKIPFMSKSWKTKETTRANHPVYVICNKAHKAEVCKRIGYHAINDCAKDREFQTKEGVRLSSYVSDPEQQTVGWLELDNGYFF
jgi:hypothetical protein